VNKQARLNIPVTAFLLITLLSVGSAAAQTNTMYGSGALASPSSVNLEDSAFGFDALTSPTSGYGNTATGGGALSSNTTGSINTASGLDALNSNTTGNDNTASGGKALLSNTTGGDNTASGFDALNNNTTGNYNTATGQLALYSNISGEFNSAAGQGALANNLTGNDNTGSGAGALYSNSTGNENTATGFRALNDNSKGNYNTATGSQALFSNITGGDDTAAGVNALLKNTTGQENTAVGVDAMFGSTTGSNNIALGYAAGYGLTTGGNNIDIGNKGVAAESNKIRIGTKGTQTATYIAGISGVGVTGGATVEVTSAGQLGIVMSSARYKHDIRDMGEKSSALLKLRPVSFRYNNDPANTLQYGLVAEEVAKIYPELVVYGPDGKVMTVRYSMLSAMLLNELQRQAKEMVAMRASTQRQIAEVKASFEEQLTTLEQAMRVQTANGKLAAAFSR